MTELGASEFRRQRETVLRAYDAGSLSETRLLLEGLREPEIAHLLESTPPKTRGVLWNLLDEETENLVLQHLSEDVRAEFLETMDTAQLINAADALDTDDFADILQQLPDQLTDQILKSLSATDRARLETVLSYEDECAGGLMDTELVTVRPRHTLEVVLRYLRLRKELPAATDALIVVNNSDEYVGMLAIGRLLTADPSVTVRELMDTDIDALPAKLPDTDVARIFSEQDLISAAVVDDHNVVIGRIT
ncbi:MAG: CBS domain-containing protein, partial [Pseudomonadota bacterium]